MSYLRAFFDKLIPGAVSDWMIILIVLGVVWLAYIFIGQYALVGIAGLFLQGNNKDRAEAKVQEAKYTKERDRQLDEVMKANADAEITEEKIREVDETVFTDSGETNEEIVNRIKRSGL